MLAHVAGVHHIAMHIARQLAKVAFPDLPLISSTRRCSVQTSGNMDAGKMKSEEFLTCIIITQTFGAESMSCNIGHIAANHSTWDLELENKLLHRNLRLIYAIRGKTMAMMKKAKKSWASTAWHLPLR